MIRSFTVLCTAVLLTATASMATAQARPGAPGQRGQAMEQRGSQGRGMAQMLLRDIALTDAQKDTIGKVTAALQSQQRVLMQGAQPGQRDPSLMQKRREMVTSHQATVRGLLTADQQVIFDRNVKAMQDRVRGGEGRDGARRGARRGTGRGT